MDDEVVPDTKDWTWVLDRICDECGYDASAVEPADLSRALLDNARTWTAVLQQPAARRRPSPGTWSPLEYGCHVRDVFRLFRTRLELVLAEDDPLFANWDQDATAVAERYAEQDPARVADELVSAADTAAALYDGVAQPDWDRPGLRSNGSRFTVASLGRYHLHDVVHHLHDVAARPSR